MSNILQDNIVAQITANNHGIKWAERFLKGTSQKETKRSLIQNRINLKRIQYAASVKAGAAIFGASQVGKSYLSNYLLASKNAPTQIYDSKGGSVGFLSSINPDGNGKEATALITRFSTNNLCGANSEYPYKVAMLSPIDIVLVIVDSYFNDIDGQIVPDKEKITDEIVRLKEKYQGKETSQDILTIDSVYEIMEYFNGGYLSKRPDFRENLLATGYFENLGNIIESIPVEDWENVFGFFWGHHPVISEIFIKLIKTAKSLNFSKITYVSLDAFNKQEGTILHVDRLYELVGLENLSKDTTDVLQIAKVQHINVMNEDGNIVHNIPKDAFCALAQEVDFSITDPTNEESKKAVEKAKPVLAKMDVLDFPGARSREEIPVANLGYESAATMVVRGKVAYLFNKYSSQYLISSLLFCQDERQSEVKSLPKLVGGWVDRMVGASVQERNAYLENVGGISPLLMVATKFNLYLKQDEAIQRGTREQNYEQMLVRWRRFGSALRNVAHIKGSMDSWFDQWSTNDTFSVIFPLRSFKFSSFDGLYMDYYEENDEIKSDESKRSAQFEAYFSELEASFLDSKSDFIQSHFVNPKTTWDSVTEAGHDGSLPILDYLKDVADKMSDMRTLLFKRVLQCSFNSLVDSLIRYYHDDNAAAELEKQRKNASRIRLSMNILFGKDKDFFSDFINQLVIDEANLHDVVLDTINAVEVVEETDNDALFAIRESAGIDFNDSYDNNLKKLMEDIACDSVENLENELSEYGLTIEQVISPYKAKNLSTMIAEAVELRWKENNLDSESYSSFSARGLKEGQLMSLLDNMGALFSKKINVAEKMAERIHPFVSGASSLDDLADMIADICAHMINKFVTSMGAAFYSDADWEAISNTKEQMNLTVSLHRDVFEKTQFDNRAIKESLAELFNAFDAADVKSPAKRSSHGSHMSNWVEFQQWMDLMEISFMATIGIPTYDVEMNDALRNVIQKYILDVPALHKSVESDKDLITMATLNLSMS